MTPATSAALSNPRKHIGQAVWLLALFVRSIPDTCSKESAAFACGGDLVSDARLEAWLRVKPRTIAVWRRRLKTAGLIDWTLKPGEGRLYVVSPLADLIFSESIKPSEPKQEPESAEPQGLQVRKSDTEPLASRFVQ